MPIDEVFFQRVSNIFSSKTTGSERRNDPVNNFEYQKSNWEWRTQHWHWTTLKQWSCTRKVFTFSNSFFAFISSIENSNKKKNFKKNFEWTINWKCHLPFRSCRGWDWSCYNKENRIKNNDNSSFKFNDNLDNNNVRNNNYNKNNNIRWKRLFRRNLWYSS